MAKRFINPNWKALRKLSHKLREAYFYCWDKADAAGVYEYDEDYMAVDLGFVLTFDELLQLPASKKIGAAKFLFRDFIEVNDNGVIKHGYNPHKPVFRAIDFHGSENFEDLNLLVETGVKENKKQFLIKDFFKLEKEKFKLENKNSKLEGEGEGIGEGEREGAGEKDGGVGEEMMVPEMFTVWKKKKPDYPQDRNKDFTALRHIATFICKQEAISFQPREPDVKNKVLEVWAQLVEFIASDDFYNSKSLTSVSFNIQSISMSIQNGTSKKGTKTGTGKVTGTELNQAFAKRYS